MHPLPVKEAAYRRTYRSGGLRQRTETARRILEACVLCPRRCRVDRSTGRTGVCKTGKYAWVSSYGPHFGEEEPLVGEKGSGTVFFTHCNLGCAFCQNYDISHEGQGREVDDEQLAQIMLALQGMGCHNINLVSPSHVVPQILAALVHAVPAGLKVPLVFNTGAYDRPQTLALLEDVVDIHMPDFKFWDPVVAAETCDAADYPEVARRALVEMHRQVGDLVVDRDGLAVRGMIVRHLVLPRNLSGTREVMEFIAHRISTDTYVNVMSQYRPCGRAREIEGFSRSISAGEFKAALEATAAAGIKRLDRPGRHLLMR